MVIKKKIMEVNNMEKEKTFKILSNEEVNKIEKQQKEALLPKEEVKEIIYSDYMSLSICKIHINYKRNS